MPNEKESTTDPLLPVDDQIDFMLRDHREMLQQAASEDATIRFGVARRLAREYRVLARYREEEQAVARQYADAVRPINERIAFLEETLERMARVYREAGLGNVMVVPGVGQWKTRRKAARWEIDNEAVLRQLDPESAFIDPGEPRPPVAKIRGAELRKYLDDLLRERVKSPQVSPEELEALAEPIEEMFGGTVRYVPEEIGVRFIPEEGQMRGFDDEEADGTAGE